MEHADQFDAIEVEILHSFGDLRVPLATWIALGPGIRPLVQPTAVYDAHTGARLPLRQIPLRYRNTVLSRLLITLRIIPNPWLPVED